MASGDIIEEWHLEYAVRLLCGIKSKTEGSWTYVGRNGPDHAIRNSVAITKLPLGRDIRKKKKKNLKKEKCDFLKKNFLWIF